MASATKLPSESFADIIKMARIISSLVGADISRPDYRINWVTIVVIFCIIIYFVFSVTTIIGMFAEDWTFMLEASCMLGSVLQGIGKLFTGIVYTEFFYSNRVILEGIYKHFEQRDSRYRVVLNESCKRSIDVIKLVGSIYAVAVTGVVSMPLLLLLLKGEHHLIMHFHIPYLDLKTDFGYFLTLGVHLVVLLAGSFGLFAGDLFTLIYLTQPLMLLDIFKIKIDELNALFEKKQVEEGSVHDALRDINKWHQFCNDYNKTVNAKFFYLISIQVTTSGISILFTLYILVNGNWPGVYVYLPLTISSLYIYCILGSKIEVCNDKFCMEIYNIKWYMMATGDQKLVATMLMKSQHPSEVKVAGVAPLSVETALQITKTLYGMFTMMLNFVEE